MRNRIHANALRWIAAGALFLLTLWPSTYLSAQEESESAAVKLGPKVGLLSVGPGMDARGKDLQGSEFVAQDLAGANFAGCDLKDVLFYQCDLSDASFKGAKLTGMQINDCVLVGANFTDATINRIRGSMGGLNIPPASQWPHDMHLSEEQMKSTRSYKEKDLSWCVVATDNELQEEEVVPKFDFRGMNLEHAILAEGDFGDCNFRDAKMTHCFFYRVRFHDQSQTGLTRAQVESTYNYTREDRAINPEDELRQMFRAIEREQSAKP